MCLEIARQALIDLEPCPILWHLIWVGTVGSDSPSVSILIIAVIKQEPESWNKKKYAFFFFFFFLKKTPNKHYENAPIQIHWKVYHQTMAIFHIKILIFFIFLLKT